MKACGFINCLCESKTLSGHLKACVHEQLKRAGPDVGVIVRIRVTRYALRVTHIYHIITMCAEGGVLLSCGEFSFPMDDSLFLWGILVS